MNEGMITAFIAGGAVVVSGLIAAGVTLASLMLRRMIRAESTNISLWTYTRLLIDHIYRGGVGPPPDPPEHFRHLYESE
ncbi:MAG: hypothetical protein ACK5O2_00865 [Microthrixaceae bacterium]